jgi:hypothetical protein
MTARIGLFTAQILLGLACGVSAGFDQGPQFGFDRPSTLGGIGRRTAGRAVSGLIMLAHHPGPDVRGTIAKDNAFAGFVLSQAADGVTIGEDQVRQIQDNDATSRLGVD